MLHKLRRDVTLREARAQAVSTMLLCDTESKRYCLLYPENTRCFLNRVRHPDIPATTIPAFFAPKAS